MNSLFFCTTIQSVIGRSSQSFLKCAHSIVLSWKGNVGAHGEPCPEPLISPSLTCSLSTGTPTTVASNATRRRKYCQSQHYSQRRLQLVGNGYIPATVDLIRKRGLSYHLRNTTTKNKDMSRKRRNLFPPLYHRQSLSPAAHSTRKRPPYHIL
jgi:hypothetical protein